MTDRNLAVARLVKDEIDGITIEEDAFGDLLSELGIAPEALKELLDPETIDWEDPPEVNVWAGDRMLAFELAEREERTVEIAHESGGEEDENQ